MKLEKCSILDALKDVGYFPVGCLTEDTLLSLRLCTMGWAVSYHHEVLAIGQSPHELTEIFKQRSRWCKVRKDSFINLNGAFLTFRRLKIVYNKRHFTERGFENKATLPVPLNSSNSRLK